MSRKQCSFLLITGVGVCCAVGAAEDSSASSEPVDSSQEVSDVVKNAGAPEIQPDGSNDTGQAVPAADETVVVLEPVEVVSDDAELIRKVDRSMKNKPSNVISPEMLRIATEQNRKLIEDAQYDARAAGRFFDEDEQNFGPADVPGTGRITFRNVAEAAGEIFEKVKKKPPDGTETEPEG